MKAMLLMQMEIYRPPKNLHNMFYNKLQTKTKYF